MWFLAAILIAVNASEDQLTLREILPFMGPTTGNTRVSVWADGVKPDVKYPNAKCRFGLDETGVVRAVKGKCTPKPKGVDDPDPSTEEMTLDCLICDPSPEHLNPEKVQFAVSISGNFDDIKNTLPFTFYTPAKVTKIFPMYGPKNGGTTVTVIGENFADHGEYLRCSIGTKETMAIFVSSTMVLCKTPPSDTVIAAMPFRILMNDIQWAGWEEGTWFAFWYYPKPSIFSLIPDRGPLSGGNDVLIEGQDLDPFNDLPEVNNHPDVFCRFGEHYIVKATIHSDILISCEAPESKEVQTVLVDVTLNAADETLNPQDWTDDFLPYTYFSMSFLFDIEPRVGPTSGGTVVTVFGSNFSANGEYSAKFGDKIVAGEYIGGNAIRCVSPPQDSAGYYDLSIATYADEFGDVVQFLYYDTPIVSSIEPSCGPITGYTQISIKGQNFSYTEQKLVLCIFGHIPLPATVLSENEILCSSPDISQDQDLIKKGVFDISITLNGKDKSESDIPLKFSYYNPHLLTNLTPKSGPTVGGTHVDIVGAGFKQKGTCDVKCRFGVHDVPARVIDDSNISCTSPPVPVPGVSMLQVALNGQQYYESEGKQTKFERSLSFKYYLNPLIAKFEPKAGPSSGNSEVIITGNGFMGKNETETTAEIYVRFNNTHTGELYGTATAHVIGLNEIKVRTPPGASNSRATLSISKNNENFVVIKNVGRTADDDFYTYYDAAHVLSLEPSYGPVSHEGGMITIRGKNFKCHDDKCAKVFAKFDIEGHPIIVKAEHISDSELRCRIPQLSKPDTVAVEVSLNGYDWTYDGVNYSYYDAFVEAFWPKVGKVEGGTDISIRGYGFANTGNDLLCRFGAEKRPLKCKKSPDCTFQAKYVSDNEIICQSPQASDVTYADTGESIGKGPIELEVSVHDGQFTKNGIKFAYYEEPKLVAPKLSVSGADGGEQVVIPIDFGFDFGGDVDGGISGGIDGKSGGIDGKAGGSYSSAQLELDNLEGITPMIRFTDGKITRTVEAQLVNFPPDRKGPPNAIGGVAPGWTGAGNAKISVSMNGEDFEGDFDYKFTEKISASKIFPRAGPVTGDTPVKITGSGFGSIDNVLVRFGTEVISVDPVNVTKDTVSTNSTPAPQAQTHGGVSHIYVGSKPDEDSTGTFTKEVVTFLYYKVPIVMDIEPTAGSNEGGSFIEVEGAWFSYVPDYKVYPRMRFGDIEVKCEFINTVRTKCPVPETKKIGKVELFLSLNGVNWQDTNHFFTFYHSPKVKSINPSSGNTDGGTIIEVKGSNFVKDVNPEEFNCRFSLTKDPSTFKIVPAHFESDSVVICMTPGGWDEGAEVAIDVSLNGHDYTTGGENKFYFFKIDSIFPRSGISGEPVTLTLQGSGFKKSKNAAVFVNHEAYPAASFSDDSITFNVPKSKYADGYIGRVDLDVTVNGVDFTNFPDGFSYYNQPNLLGVSPLFGPIGGLDPLVITADLLSDDYPQFNGTCKVGPYIGVLTVIDSTTGNCILPPELEGTDTDTGLDVSISVNGKDYTDSNFKYSVYGLIDIEPKNGPISGGTDIIIQGFGFLDAYDGYKAQCRFGTKENFILVDARIMDLNHLICVSPTDLQGSGIALEAPLEIGFARDGDSVPWTNAGKKFFFYQNPVITSISPAGCAVEDECLVDLVAKGETNFENAIPGASSGQIDDTMHNIVCRFGDYGVTPATYINKNTIKCMSPRTEIVAEDVTETEIEVFFSMDGQEFYPAGTFFLYGCGDDAYWILMIWIGCISCAMCICGLLACCCYTMFHRAKKSESNEDAPLRDNDGMRAQYQEERKEVQERGGSGSGGSGSGSSSSSSSSNSD